MRRSAHAPGGRADILFHIPHTVGFVHKGTSVEQQDLDIAVNQLAINHHPVYRDKDLHELLMCYVHIHSIKMARDAEDGLNMYIKLLNLLSNDGFFV